MTDSCHLLCIYFVYTVFFHYPHNLDFISSLVVVENVWDKSPHSNIFSFSDSVHPQVHKKKKVSMNCSWANVFIALSKGHFSLFTPVLENNGVYK